MTYLSLITYNQPPYFIVPIAKEILYKINYDNLINIFVYQNSRGELK